MYNAYISDKNGMSERRKKVKKKALYKKWMSMLLAGVVTTTGFMGGTVTLRAAETTNWVGDEGLSGTADAPEPDKVVPDANQFRYQKEELAHSVILDRIHSMRLNGENIMGIKHQVKFLN